jgi:predicted metal-dependent hydrolase
MIDNLEYKLVRSLRSRSIRITVYPNGEVKVSAPHLVPEFVVRNFVNKKSVWIDKKLKHFQKKPNSKLKLFLHGLKRKDYLEQRDKALVLVKERLEHFNKHYRVNYKKVTIRNQKSRWGSCSHNGNLNFNYKIIYLPKEAQDYIVVHELCHIIELNHSKSFWNLVQETMPDYKSIRRGLA